MSDLDPQMVRMRHPELDTVRAFPASAVPIHVTSGWQVVEDEPARTDADADGASEVAAKDSGDAPGKTPKSGSGRAAKNEE